MNRIDIPDHPAPEVWADYLYNELAPAEHARLAEHLRSCADCQRQVGQWRETMSALDSWRVQARTPRRGGLGYARWAAAAALAVGLGWVGGRFSAPPAPSMAELQAALAPALRQELQAEFQADLQTALNAMDERTRQQFAQLAQAWALAREQDRQASLALYGQVERQQRAQYAALRRAIETVAVNAEGAIGNTQEQLTQLAANTR